MDWIGMAWVKVYRVKMGRVKMGRVKIAQVNMGQVKMDWVKMGRVKMDRVNTSWVLTSSCFTAGSSLHSLHLLRSPRVNTECKVNIVLRPDEYGPGWSGLSENGVSEWKAVSLMAEVPSLSLHLLHIAQLRVTQVIVEWKFACIVHISSVNVVKWI